MRSKTAKAVPQGMEVTDWRTAAETGWEFCDSRMPGFGGQIGVSTETVRLQTDRNAPLQSVEAAYTRALSAGEGLSIQFAARFHRLGLEDDGTGGQANLRLEIGARTRRGSWGVRFQFTGDRYDLGKAYKVFRTDGSWHNWRFDVDTVRKVVAMYRDGEYVCLHECSARMPAGVRLRVGQRHHRVGCRDWRVLRQVAGC